MKIALISGSRSDRNALVMVEKALRDAKCHDVSIVSIEPAISARRRKDPAWTVVVSAEYVADRIAADDPDMVVVHGDRHEVLGAVVAANVLKVPIAHIGGGDLTEGSQDDCFRHSITKLSHIHFVSHDEARGRVIQLGEEPDRVFTTGCPGIDMVMATDTIGRKETFEVVGLDGLVVARRALLVLFHPETLSDTRPSLDALSDALMARTEALVLLGPNADAGSNLIREEWQRLAANRPDTVYRDNVEPQVFYSLLRWCDALVGNSSAGFYEAPCFAINVLNIGDRQKGRPNHCRIVNLYTELDAGTIYDFIGQAVAYKAEPWSSNPYGDGHASERIAKVIGGIEDSKALLRKRWHQMPTIYTHPIMERLA